MFMTPLTAFAPHTVPPGPRITSMRSMSSQSPFPVHPEHPRKCRVIHAYTVYKHEQLVENSHIKLRVLTAHVLLLSRATSMPGTPRRASGIFFRARASNVFGGDNVDGDAVSKSFSGFLDADVTLTFSRSSMLSSVKSLDATCTCAGSSAVTDTDRHTLATTATAKIAANA